MAAPSATVAKLRASKARRLQSYPADHPKVEEVGQALDYEVLAEHAARVVANWPKPTEAQLARVAAILQAGGAPPGDSPHSASGGTTSPSKNRKAVVDDRVAELDGIAEASAG